MEKVYVPDKLSTTEPIDYEKYFKEYQTECDIKPRSDDDFENRLAILREEFKLPLGLEDVKELEALCTIDKLTVFNENPKLPLNDVPKSHCLTETHPITEESKSLSTVRRKEEFNALKDELQMELTSRKILLDDWKDDPNLVKDISPGSDFIHKILIFVPFTMLSGNKATVDSFRFQYEIEVLGTNTLLELADSIKCISDTAVIREVPDIYIDLSEFQNAKEEYPSRSFFIENVFYNDMSHPNAIDYSEVVREWAIEKKIGNFRSETMVGVTFASLKPRLGYGYVYIHQGNCEHIMQFTDSRLILNRDCLDSKRYPRIVSMKRDVNHLCFICLAQHASWMVINSDRLPVNKAFFCTKCCESYMFLDGKKVGKFQLYPYVTGTLTTDDEDDITEQDMDNWDYSENS